MVRGVDNYTLRVVGNGIKAQTANPEVKVKEGDPVIHQIIDKLKHINQLLQGKSIPKFGTLDLIETGSGHGEGRGYSGDCDDEDGCGGSGGGEVKRKVMTVSKLAPGSDHRHHPQGEDSETGDRSSSQALRSQAATLLLALVLTSLLTTRHVPSCDTISPLL
ncbi:glypican-5-like [Oncorhynchus clarkii lewisi]|uniref:glypican-5-like n=1 Tax=Oncorhynchus clarkii lewisi TaxID=490388 RepID=UPI0039B83A5E